MRVTAQALMGHQDVGTLTRQALEVVRKDRRPVAKRQAAAPAFTRPDDPQAIGNACESRFEGRRPDRLPEDAAEAGYPEPGDVDDPAVKIAVGQFRATGYIPISLERMKSYGQKLDEGIFSEVVRVGDRG